MKRLLATIFAVIAFAGTASAGPVRLRGTITAASETTLTLQTQDGTKTLALDAKTAYATAMPATLADVQAGKYIGTATKTAGTREIALEVVIFPDSMRGTGEGHYPWDTITDTTARGTTHSSMTNGSVTSAMPGKARQTGSSMTNGNISTTSNMAGDKTLVVTYKGGMQEILLPPTAPIIEVAPATQAALSTGAQVFVVAAPGTGGFTVAYIVIATHGAKLAM